VSSLRAGSLKRQPGGPSSHECAVRPLIPEARACNQVTKTVPPRPLRVLCAGHGTSASAWRPARTACASPRRPGTGPSAYGARHPSSGMSKRPVSGTVSHHGNRSGHQATNTSRRLTRWTTRTSWSRRERGGTARATRISAGDDRRVGTMRVDRLRANSEDQFGANLGPA
jgi:hypothetical protein